VHTLDGANTFTLMKHKVSYYYSILLSSDIYFQIK